MKCNNSFTIFQITAKYLDYFIPTIFIFFLLAKIPQTINGTSVRLVKINTPNELREPRLGECIKLNCLYCYVFPADHRCSCGCEAYAECNFEGNLRNTILLRKDRVNSCYPSVFNANHKKTDRKTVVFKKHTQFKIDEQKDATSSKIYLVTGSVLLLVFIAFVFNVVLRCKGRQIFFVEREEKIVEMRIEQVENGK